MVPLDLRVPSRGRGATADAAALSLPPSREEADEEADDVDDMLACTAVVFVGAGGTAEVATLTEDMF